MATLRGRAVLAVGAIGFGVTLCVGLIALGMRDRERQQPTPFERADDDLRAMEQRLEGDFQQTEANLDRQMRQLDAQLGLGSTRQARPNLVESIGALVAAPARLARINATGAESDRLFAESMAALAAGQMDRAEELRRQHKALTEQMSGL
jgi:hypothetical protein